MSSDVKTPNGRRTVLIGIVLVVVLSIIGSITAYIMYHMIKTAPEPKVSPDRSMVLVESITDSKGDPETHMRVKVTIHDAKSGAELFHSQTKASALRKWDTNWMANDHVTMYSTEIGRLNWRRDGGGVWHEDLENGDRVVPAATRP